MMGVARLLQRGGSLLLREALESADARSVPSATPLTKAALEAMLEQQSREAAAGATQAEKNLRAQKRKVQRLSKEVTEARAQEGERADAAAEKIARQKIDEVQAHAEELEAELWRKAELLGEARAKARRLPELKKVSESRMAKLKKANIERAASNAHNDEVSVRALCPHPQAGC
eukprot:scaffold23883_cov103-Isochrysis_galbana.AAC.3